MAEPIAETVFGMKNRGCHWILERKQKLQGKAKEFQYCNVAMMRNQRCDWGIYSACSLGLGFLLEIYVDLSF